MAAVALYVKALDVTTDYSEQEPWFTCFKLAAADTVFGDEAGLSPSAGVGGGGLRGASSAPDEQAAALQLLGGQPAPEPQVEGSRADRRKQREATKQRRAAMAQELQQLRAWKQARAHPGGSVEGSSGKVATMGYNGKKGKSNLHSKTHDSKEFYDSGDDMRDKCAVVAPGKPFSSGRADEKRIFVEHNRVEHAVYLGNARGVEARVVLRMEASQTNLYSHVLSKKELAPGALSLSGRSNSFADSSMFTTSASPTEVSSSRIFRCCRRASSRSQTLVGMPGSSRAQRLWQERGRPWLPSGRKRGHRQSLWSFGLLAVRSSSPHWKTLRQEGSGAGPTRCWRRISGQPLRRVKDVLYGASPRHSSIGGCRLLQWPNHCCPLVCLVTSCARGPLLVRALSRRSSVNRQGDREGPRGEEDGPDPVHRLGRGHLLPWAERFERRVAEVLKGMVVWDFEDRDREAEPILAFDGR